LVELLKIRVSQVNGCAFCLRAHTEEALTLGETTERLAVLQAWRKTDYFDDVERAALDLAERVTMVASHEGLPASTEASAPLTEAQVSATAWVAIALNAFNRIAITSGYPVAPREGRQKPAAA
jgi:AhpD family alkylhydroperoxidase